MLVYQTYIFDTAGEEGGGISPLTKPPSPLLDFRSHKPSWAPEATSDSLNLKPSHPQTPLRSSVLHTCSSTSTLAHVHICTLAHVHICSASTLAHVHICI